MSLIITLDVGGGIYKLSKNNILKYPTSLLARMFADNQMVPIVQQSDGSFYFDRPKHLFKHIQTFYQTGRYPGVDEDGLKEEFEFWGLNTPSVQPENTMVTFLRLYEERNLKKVEQYTISLITAMNRICTTILASHQDTSRPKDAVRPHDASRHMLDQIVGEYLCKIVLPNPTQSDFKEVWDSVKKFDYWKDVGHSIMKLCMGLVFDHEGRTGVKSQLVFTNDEKKKAMSIYDQLFESIPRWDDVAVQYLCDALAEKLGVNVSYGKQKTMCDHNIKVVKNFSYFWEYKNNIQEIRGSNCHVCSNSSEYGRGANWHVGPKIEIEEQYISLSLRPGRKGLNIV